jgi:geranylgeranyl diphosphate synthase, type II
MFTLIEAQNLIEKHIQNLSIPDSPPELYEPVRYFLSLGGKRIRPALVILACDLFAGAVEPALIPAMAIEIFHNFTLLHDDIMDRSELRRGSPAVQVKYNENVAILSGDVMSILASRMMNQAPAAVLNVVQDIFTKTAMQVCEGQQLDMNFEERTSVSEEEYLNMIELKTAVLIAGALKIGAILGGSSQRDADDLYQFGKNLGVAFQLQDDLLDTYGDPAMMGKNVGADIVDNKKTFLVIQGLKVASDAQKEELTDWLGRKEFDRDEKIREVTSLFDKLKVKEITERRIKDYYGKAIINLENLNRPEDRKSELYKFASVLMNRIR